MSARLTALTLLLVLSALTACQPLSEAHSEPFKALVEPDKGQFRGHSLGQSMDLVRRSEPGQPVVEDEWGLVYQRPLADGVEATLEYFTEANDPTRALAGITANISLPGEVEASQLYRELQAWLDAKYAVPDGGFGFLQWRVPQENTEVVLRLMDSKTAISLNFYRPQDRLSNP